MKKSLTAEIFGVFSTNFSVLILSIFTGIITSRVLGPDGKGVLTAILVVPTMIRSLCELGLRQSTMYYLGRGIFDEKRYIGSVLCLYLLTSSLSIVLTAWIYAVLDNPAFTLSSMSLALLTLPINLLLTYSGGVFLGKDLISKFNRQRWVPAVTGLIGVVAFVWLLKWGVWGALLAMVLSQIIIAIFNVHYIVRCYGLIKPLFDVRILGAILKLGLLYGISLFVIQMNYRVNIVLLERLSSVEQIGYFSVGANIAEMLWQLPAALSVIILSKSATSKNQEKLSSDVLKLLRLTLLAGVVLAVGLFFAIPLILPLVYGDAFIPSVKVVQAILPGVVMMIIFKVLNSRLAGLGKPYYALYVFAPTLILNIVLDILWIPRYHAVGVAMASNVCWLISTVVFLCIYSSRTQTSLKEMFGYRKSDFNFLKRFYSKA